MEPTDRVEVPDAIRALVNCYELHSYVSPLYEYLDGNKVQIGWQLEVSGTCPPWCPFEMLQPTADRAVCDALRQFICWVISNSNAEDRMIELSCEPQKTYFWGKHQNRPDKLVTAYIRTPSAEAGNGHAPDVIRILEKRILLAGAGEI